MIKKVNERFIPVSLKAQIVDNPPRNSEGRLYREIGRSKVLPQGICVINSAGKVLAWSLMFDDEASVPAFLDHCLELYKKYPGADEPVPAERYTRYPLHRRKDTADTREDLPSSARHGKDEGCFATPALPRGTLAGRIYGRTVKDGKPYGDPLWQEHYVEDLFTLSLEDQEALDNAGDKPFRLPAAMERTLVSVAYLGMLDVQPLEFGGKGEWELWASRDGRNRLRVEGKSHLTGSMDEGRRKWSHEITLKWRGFIERDGRRVTRLALIAEGNEKLKWGNPRHYPKGVSAVTHLPAGRVIDLDSEVRYGLVALPVTGDGVGGK